MRVARYLKEKPRLVWKFGAQEEIQKLDVYTDSNYCGCRASRKSTTGGCILQGNHCLKAWSKTQAVVALSSAEAELYGAVKGACEVLGAASLKEDFGEEVGIQMHMDASAAIGIVERKGLCKMRHLDLNNLWLQEVEARNMIPARKVGGAENQADLMTTHVAAKEIDKYLKAMGLEFRSGRSEKAVGLHNLEGKRTGDSWDSRGCSGKWVRKHGSWRSTLFTPYKVTKGPGGEAELAVWRKTQRPVVRPPPHLSLRESGHLTDCSCRRWR